MNIGRLTAAGCGVMVAIGLAAAGATPSAAQALAQAQAVHAHEADRPAKLVQIVREATRSLQTTDAAAAAGYDKFLGCVSGPQSGAMGTHYVNNLLVGDGAIDSRQPEAMIYETRNGRTRLVGVEYIVLADAWHERNETPPTLEGQVFHYNGSPNRYALPAFYELHVWAWRDNPSGAFADWNPHVSCEGAVD